MINVKVIDNFISEELSKDLIDDFDSLIGDGGVKKIHGGRASVPSSHILFQDLMQRSSQWKDLYAKLNSASFFEYCLSQLGIERKYKRGFKLVSFFTRPLVGLRLKIKRVSQKPTYQLPASILGGIFLYRLLAKLEFFLTFLTQRLGLGPWPVELLFDVSRSGNGYVNAIHRDSDSRLIVFLIYFNKIDGNGSGGNLDVLKYKHKEVLDPPVYPALADCDLIDSVVPEAGRLVIFENTKDAFHSVQEMVNCSGYRYFCYGGFSVLTGLSPSLSDSKHRAPTEFYIYS